LRIFPNQPLFNASAAAFPPPVAIEVKVCTAKRTHVAVGPAKFDVNRRIESPLWGEKPDFWPVSKFNTGSFAASRHPAGKSSFIEEAVKCLLRVLVNAGHSIRMCLTVSGQ